MTPVQKIMFTILELKDSELEGDIKLIQDVGHRDIECVWDDNQEFVEDILYEFREGEVETKLTPKEYSRHYECHEVASQMFDGSWVGWTYWYGGGKHGEPESIDWMEHAYDLKVTEEEKLVVVRTFTKEGE